MVVKAIIIMTTDPPFYILCSSSPISTAVPGAPSTTLGHPEIQYHYKDDSPFALLPQTQDEQILILDWDPNGVPTSVPAVRSISRNVAVTAVRVAEAPGAAAEDEVRNDRMYIIETTTSTSFDERCVALVSHNHCSLNNHLRTTAADLAVLARQPPQAILSQFKQRSALTSSCPYSISQNSFQEMPYCDVHSTIRTKGVHRHCPLHDHTRSNHITA